MDSSQIIPGGYYFGRPFSANGMDYLLPYKGDDSAPHIMKTRTEAGPMHYYFIDFGLSVRFSSFEARELVYGEYGQLCTHIPEISSTVAYDPFKVDVRSVGEMLWIEFLPVSIIRLAHDFFS
jgi:hypothetical protein